MACYGLSIAVHVSLCVFLTGVTSPVATPRLTSLPPGAIDPADIEAMIAAGADISVLRFDFSFVKEVSRLWPCVPSSAELWLFQLQLSWL
jgi:hypothetical protein